MQLENCDMPTPCPCSTTERPFREPISGKQVASVFWVDDRSQFLCSVTKKQTKKQKPKKNPKTLPCHTKIYIEAKSNNFNRTGFWLIPVSLKKKKKKKRPGSQAREKEGTQAISTPTHPVYRCASTPMIHFSSKKMVFLLPGVGTTSYKWMNQETLNRKIVSYVT